MASLSAILVRTTLLALLVISSFANAAEDGPGTTGGLNLVNGKPIEQWVKPLKDFDGYDGFREKLKFIDENLPEFGIKIRNRLKKVAFYKLPIELKELPQSVTGFGFKSEQCALQPMGKDIVIISEPCLARLQAADKVKGTHSAALAITHEVIMALQPKEKDWAAVHFVGNLLFSEKADHYKIQDALLDKKFGFYLTPAQELGFRLTEKANYLASLSFQLKYAADTCKINEDTAYLNFKAKQLGSREAVFRKTLGIVSTFLLPKAPSVLDRLPGGAFQYPSIFNTQDFSRGLANTLTGYEAETNKLGWAALQSDCGTLSESMCAQLKAPEKASKENQSLLTKLSANVQAQLEKDLADLRIELAKQKSFTDIFALLTTDAALEKAPNIDPYGVLKVVIPEVRSKRTLVKGLDTEATVKQLCSAVNMLAPKVKKLMEEADVVAKKHQARNSAGAEDLLSIDNLGEENSNKNAN